MILEILTWQLWRLGLIWDLIGWLVHGLEIRRLKISYFEIVERKQIGQDFARQGWTAAGYAAKARTAAGSVVKAKTDAGSAAVDIDLVVPNNSGVGFAQHSSGLLEDPTGSSADKG